jgi:hypothetical protein
MPEPGVKIELDPESFDDLAKGVRQIVWYCSKGHPNLAESLCSSCAEGRYRSNS